MTSKHEDIKLEASLLKTLAIKKNYDRFCNALDKTKLIPITKKFLEHYKSYFDKYNNDIDWELFYNEISQNTPELDRDDIAYYRETVLPLVQNAEIKDSLYTVLLEREATVSIMESLQTGFCHEKIQEIVAGLKSQLQIHSGANDEDIFKLSNVDLNVLDVSNGLNWFLPSLQAGISSHMPGQFVLVSADSGAGKSAFCISQAVHVFRQLHERAETRPILYCTSEDTREDLVGRFMSNLYKEKCLGGFEEIIQKFPKVKGHFSSNYNEDLFVGMQIRNHKDMSKLRRKIDILNPSVVIIDMLDVLSESLDIQCLTKTYNEIRAIANDGFPILGTTQAGDTSYKTEDGQIKHRKWLTEKHTAGSKGGGKQGAAYCMIMLGMDDDMPGVRYLTTTKKKRGSHVRCTCQLIDKYSLYQEVL